MTPLETYQQRYVAGHGAGYENGRGWRPNPSPHEKLSRPEMLRISSCETNGRWARPDSRSTCVRVCVGVSVRLCVWV